MEFHFLGTTGYHPNDQRQTACMMLPDAGLILDAGTGMFRVRDLIRTNRLDIFLSHAHLDHSIGLTFLYDVLFNKPDVKVTVHLAAEKIEAIENHLYSPYLFPVKPNFDFQPLGSQPVELATGEKVTPFDVEHPGGCHGFRIDWPDRSLAYVTDTTAQPGADYVQQILGVDTLVHECYFPDGWEDRAQLTGHSCLTPVAQIAREAGVGKLFLVHINPLEKSESPLDLDSVKEIFSDITVASDNLIIDV